MNWKQITDKYISNEQFKLNARYVARELKTLGLTEDVVRDAYKEDSIFHDTAYAMIYLCLTGSEKHKFQSILKSIEKYKDVPDEKLTQVCQESIKHIPALNSIKSIFEIIQNK